MRPVTAASAILIAAATAGGALGTAVANRHQPGNALLARVRTPIVNPQLMAATMTQSWLGRLMKSPPSRLRATDVQRLLNCCGIYRLRATGVAERGYEVEAMSGPLDYLEVLTRIRQIKRPVVIRIIVGGKIVVVASHDYRGQLKEAWVAPALLGTAGT